MTETTAHTCPCGSGQSYGHCCEPVHKGGRAATPEALMRSRYSAFALGLDGYLMQSWHSSTRPAELGSLDGTRWRSLQIFGSGETDGQGWVHFRATFSEQGRWAYLEERSEFRQEQGHWRYVTGTPEVRNLQPERNGPCPCGSGRKFKKCCQD